MNRQAHASGDLAGQGRQPGRNGFTIVETLLVLAIAGVFMMVVLEVIPGLERSGRNNQRRQDVQTILGAVSHYELNNSGNLPPPRSGFLNQANLTYYTNSVSYLARGVGCGGNGICVYIYNNAAGSPLTLPGNSLPDTVQIHNYERCSNSPPGTAANTGAGYNDVVALFAVESASGSVSQCQQL